MAANKKVNCEVVWMPEYRGGTAPAQARPSDLLPWADPYIASLVKKLQREVRSEVRAKEEAARSAEEPPSPWDLWDMCYDESDARRGYRRQLADNQATLVG